MAYKYLVIVESPAKAKTIEKYLGRNYKVVASVGHIRDLPKSKMGIDIENNYEPHYISIRGKGDVIKSLKAAAKKAEKVYLAADPDREGEAIAWHLAYLLGLDLKDKNRVVFNEITKEAVKAARGKKGPKLIELMVSRLTSHSADDDQSVYRSKEEIEEMKKNDAVKLFEKQLLEEGYLTDEDIAKIDEEIRAEINQATDEAESMPDPVPTSILEEVYAK